MNPIEAQIEELKNKDQKTAYQALKHLLAISETRAEVSYYFDKFVMLLQDPQSYVRTRGLLFDRRQCPMGKGEDLRRRAAFLLGIDSGSQTDHTPPVYSGPAFPARRPSLAQAFDPCRFNRRADPGRAGNDAEVDREGYSKDNAGNSNPIRRGKPKRISVTG